MRSSEDCIIAAWEEQQWAGCGELREFWEQLSLHDFSLREQRNLFFELAALAMEFAWKRSRQQPVPIENRAAALAEWELCDAELRSRLFVEEYRVRWRFGDRPSRERFLLETPIDSISLRRALDDVDQELRDEFRIAGARVQMQLVSAFDPRAPLNSADYLVQRFIGAGSSGRVYRALQHSLQRPVALKFLRKSFLQDESAIDRFLQEARFAGRLRHPGIIAIHGLGRTPGGSYFIAMDLVEGQPLRPLRQSGERLASILHAIAQAAEAMSVAHEAGIIHCDLKPANILRDPRGLVTITDFGLARQAVGAQAARRIEGTPAWIAPEQVDSCWGRIGPVTDVFNLAATLFWLLTGMSPHDGVSATELMASAVSGTPIARLRDLQPAVPAALEELCAAGLEKSLGERSLTMEKFAAELRAIANELAS